MQYSEARLCIHWTNDDARLHFIPVILAKKSQRDVTAYGRPTTGALAAHNSSDTPPQPNPVARQSKRRV